MIRNQLELAAKLIEQGYPVDVALDKATRARRFKIYRALANLRDYRKHRVSALVIPHKGAPHTIPNASCVKARLAGITKPSREQIMAAMRACMGKG